MAATTPRPAGFTAARTPWALLVVGLALWPAWPILSGHQTVLADPLKYILHHTGYAASLILALTLALTPLRRLGGERPWARGLSRHRRFLGVSAAALAVLHLGVHVLYEGGPGVLLDNLTKPFLVAGLIALTVLLVLTATSIQAAQRKLGRRWKSLHRLAYVAMALVAYHQVASHKLFPVDVLWVWVPLLALQATRFWTRRSVTPT